MLHELSAKQREARARLCLPLDNLYTLEEVANRVEELSPYVGLFKVGKGTFTRFGPKAVDLVQDYNADVFLDLKYHDIPNTVEDAADAATWLEVRMFNLHIVGGGKMMEAAIAGATKAAEKYGVRRPDIFGVTILTSLDAAKYLDVYKPVNPELKQVDFGKYIDVSKDDEALQEEFRALLKLYNLTGIIQTQVAHLADMAYNAGLDGCICSAADLFAFGDKLPKEFKRGTPGIEGTTTPAGYDQSPDRVFSPGNAISAGSDILIAGRAITKHGKAEERQQAAFDVLTDMADRI